MQVIPAINCTNKKCASDRIEIIKKIKGVSWVHIDVEDGIFTPNATWADPKEMEKCLEGTRIKVEAHLMTNKPLKEYEQWEEGAERIIIHIEKVREIEIEKLVRGDKHTGVAISPETSVERLVPYLQYVNFVQVLAVLPGPTGQVLHDSTVGKIEWLRNKKSELTIECDGGVTEETAILLKHAGTDILVSGSYIFSGQKPEERYRKLARI